MTDLPTDLVDLRGRLHDRIAADIAGGRGRPTRRPLVAAAALLLLVIGGGALVRHEPRGEQQVVTGAEPDSPRADAVARTLPDSAVLFLGTAASCTEVEAGSVVDCQLDRSPAVENGTDYRRRTETLVDDGSVIVGGCRGQDAAGRHWTCYLGSRAVTESIIAPDLLGRG
jgi:hypothetical protein